MSTVQHISYIAYARPITQAGAFNNDLGMRVALDGKGAMWLRARGQTSKSLVRSLGREN